VAGTYISKICVATVLRHARRLAKEASDYDTEATIQNRLQKLSGLKEVFPDAGEFLSGALCRIEHTVAPCSAVGTMLELGRLQWRKAQLVGDTRSFDDFHR
jgi:hypothetical protein